MSGPIQGLDTFDIECKIGQKKIEHMSVEDNIRHYAVFQGVLKHLKNRKAQGQMKTTMKCSSMHQAHHSLFTLMW